MSSPIETYSVHAIKYAHHERRSSDNFIGGDSHDVPMPLDYFVWLVSGGGRTWLVDTGFDKASGDKRGGRRIDHPVEEGLRGLGVEPETIEDVILTHMHYDHAGNGGLFPKARYHVQDTEMAFCTGRCMCHRTLAVHYEPDDVASMVYKLFENRVVFHDGDDEIAPGLSVHRVGGHTDGLQVVRVHTQSGWMVLASDTTHFYANIEGGRPFPAVYNVGDMLEGFNRIYDLADSPGLVIPGHDPQVLERFPSDTPEHEGWIVRLDAGMR